MIVEKLITKGILGQDPFPGSLNKRDSLSGPPAVYSYRHGIEGARTLIEQEHRFDLVVERIEIEVPGNADDPAKGIPTEMFADQPRHGRLGPVRQQLFREHFIYNEFVPVTGGIRGEVSARFQWDLIYSKIIRIHEYPRREQHPHRRIA